MKTLVVVNPNSANRRTGRQWPHLREVLQRAIGSFDEAMTTRGGHATELVRTGILAGARRIVSVGGDGTHNEVVNGFFDPQGQRLAPEAILGLVPRGTGGDFRKSLGLGSEEDSWSSALRDGHVRTCDIGLASYLTAAGERQNRFFLNIASFGLSGKVDETVNRTSKVLGGKASFLLGTLRAIAGWRNQAVKLEVHGAGGEKIIEEQIRIVTVAVANGQYFGGGMWIAPKAQLDDGQFDVVVLGDLPKRTLVSKTGRIYRGTHLEMKNVWMVRGSKVEADSQETVLIDLDGEQVGRLPLSVQIRQGALQILAPGKGKESTA